MAGIIQDQAYFDQQVAPHIDGDRVCYLGSVGPAARDALLGGASALLHLINFDEPFGLSMVEAMACGTPVLAYRRGSVPEVVHHGESGWIVDTLDEAVVALQQLAAIDRAGVRAYIAAHFSRERMVDDYLHVYETVLQQRDGSP